MKNWLVICFCVFGFNMKSYGKGNFEGIIEYSLQLEGEGSELAAAFLFSGYTFYFGENGVRMEMEGGMSFMLGPFVTSYLTGKTYMLMDDEKVAYEVEDDEAETNEQELREPLIEDTHEEETILGYKTRKYRITNYEDGEETVYYYWVTDQISIKAVGEQMGINLTVSGLSGCPLKIESQIEDIKMTQTVIGIKKERLEDGFFTAPADYEIKPFSESALGEMGEDD